MAELDSADDNIVRNYAMSASFAWLLFEYCITLDQEIDLFWGKKITGASVLFLSNRYLPLLCALWWAPWWRQSLSFNGCVVQQILGGLMEYSVYVPIAAFSALRVYALSGKKRKWAIVTFLLSVSPCLIALVVCPWVTFGPDAETGCRTQYNIPFIVQAISVLSARLFLVIADLVVLSVTWSRTFKHRKPCYSIPTVSGVMFRDGTIYFVAQLLLNALYLISMLLFSKTFAAEDLNSIASLFVLPATSVLVTHFILDLQHTSRRSAHLPVIHASNWERMMGSVGLVLPDDEEDDPGGPVCQR